MKLIILSRNGELINKHSDSSTGWSNPFGERIPSTGDIVNIGATNFGRDNDIDNGTRYKVISREFKSYATYNHRFDNQSCVLTVEEVAVSMNTF